MSSNPILPTEVVEKIVGHCDFPVVQALRKSSNRLRDLAEKVAPTSTITSIYMKSNRESIQLHLITGNPTSENAELLFPEGNRLNIEYRPHEQGCCVVLEKEGGMQSTKILEGEEYKTLFWQDFETLLYYHGDAVLENFHVDFEQVEYGRNGLCMRVMQAGHYCPFLEKLGPLLDTNRLRVKNVAMKLRYASDFTILQYLDPNIIERIQTSWISRRSPHYSSRPHWDFMRFLGLPQWSRAKHLDIEDFMMNTVQHVLHFETVKGVREICEEHDFNNMVESIFTSANHAKHYTFRAMWIRFLVNLRRTHGDSPDNKWFFRSPGTDMIVEFSLSQGGRPGACEIKMVKMEEVEAVGRIQDWARVHLGRMANAGIANDDEQAADGNANGDGDLGDGDDDNEAEDNNDFHV